MLADILGTLISYILLVIVLFLTLLIIYTIRSRNVSEGSSFDVIGTEQDRGELLDKLELCSFDDICGLTKEKQYLKELLSIFNNYDSFIERGIEPVRGVLLYGNPGCGKTMLAKAMAREANVNFICRSASDLVKGSPVDNIKKLFEKARSCQPCILFIDELDIIAKHRSGMNPLEITSATTQFLAEMDGFGSKDKILVVATTNLLNNIDKALLRPGRFSRKYLISPPLSREDVISVVNKYKPAVEFSQSLVDDIFEKLFYGMSPADIKVILHEAGAQSIISGKPVDLNILNTMASEIMFGACKSVSPIGSKSIRHIIAIHEAGHAIVTAVLGKTVMGITTLSLGSAGGMTSIGADSNSDILVTIRDIKNNILVSYGGLEAELIHSDGDEDSLTLGCAEDIQAASKYARLLTISYNIAENNGYSLNPDLDGNTTAYDEAVLEAKKLLVQLRLETRAILERNRDILFKLSDTLVENVEMSFFDVKKFFEDNPVS